MVTKDQAAERLAGMHYTIESGLSQVFRVHGPADRETRPDEPIKLLEVNDNTVPLGIMPIQFGPDPARGLFYSSIIIEVTPHELREILGRRLELPNGWELGEEIPRPADAEA
ncbi:MAG: hypothetical protein SFX72_13620 [Isosphaeraceae bacterium]|nr:hypothetical protein [Isosphaeraceae bacterium]